MALELGVSVKKSKKEAEAITSILNDAKYTCSCCGYQSAPNKNGDVQLEKDGFMYLVVGESGKEIVVCTVCYYTMNMDMLEKPGFIYYPWLTQEQLNYLLNYIYTILVWNNVKSQVTKASGLLLHFNGCAMALKKIDPTLTKEPKKLAHLLSWLKMEEPKDYKNRTEKYLKNMRLVPFLYPINSVDIKAVFNYSASLLHEVDWEETWDAVWYEFVKNRQQGMVA